MRLCYNDFGDSMNGNFINKEIVELTSGIVEKISGLYPNNDIQSKLSSMHIVESEVGERTPFVFDQPTNTIRLNFTELQKGNYDCQYYMTVALLNMTKPYDSSLQGLRTGYFAGIASNLVGNFTRETASEVESGIDLYESLRIGIADLSSKIGAAKATELCEVESFEDFMELATQLGIANPEQFLNQYNYLALNSVNLTAEQIADLVKDVIKANEGLSLDTDVKHFN